MMLVNDDVFSVPKHTNVTAVVTINSFCKHKQKQEKGINLMN